MNIPIEKAFYRNKKNGQPELEKYSDIEEILSKVAYIGTQKIEYGLVELFEILEKIDVKFADESLKESIAHAYYTSVFNFYLNSQSRSVYFESELYAQLELHGLNIPGFFWMEKINGASFNTNPSMMPKEEKLQKTLESIRREINKNNERREELE